MHMSLLVLTGPPGAGKTAHAIEALEKAGAAGRPTFTVVCADVARSTRQLEHLQRGRFASRNGRSWPIDGFLTESELAGRLATVPAGTLLVVEDTYGYSPAVVEALHQASQRGSDVLVVAPSSTQTDALTRLGAQIISLSRACDRCGQREAGRPVLDPATGDALAYCDDCFATARDEALSTIIATLRDGGPHNGQEYLYQPVELPVFAGWSVVRPDSPKRAALMHALVLETGLEGRNGRHSYLDVGSLTGYFCDYFAARGFTAQGVDLTRTNVMVARALEAFFRRPARENHRFVVYQQQDAYDYLRQTQHQGVDVTSALSVFQWVMLQKDVQTGLDCIQLLAAKTRRVMFLEMGYSDEDMYKEQLPIPIDREWMHERLLEAGFPKVVLIDRHEHGLRRDIVAGVR
jgi:hypothetical protein